MPDTVALRISARERLGRLLDETFERLDAGGPQQRRAQYSWVEGEQETVVSVLVIRRKKT